MSKRGRRSFDGLDLAGATVLTFNHAALDALTAVAPAAVAPIHPTPGRWVVTIENFLPDTINKLTRGTRRARIRGGKHCREIVGEACRKAKVPGARGKRFVHLDLYFKPKPGPRADPDAWYKATFDALKHARALVDDTYELVDFDKPTYFDSDVNRTVITLEDREH